MGKKKERKAGKGKEKTERKTAKAAEKRARRDDKKTSEEDDIDAILAKIKKEEAKKVEIHVDDNVTAPSPRCNFSVTVNPLKDTELVVFGGEFYNGDKTYVYGDLFRFNVEKREWKLVSSPNSPPPRSAHQAVAWKNWLFIFGGEFTSPNQERFHHYKDLWRMDLNTNAWEQLQLKGSPSPRSGHRMVLYKHKLIIFGGFYDTLREVRYYNDLHVLDLDEYKWQDIKPKPGALWPSPRSGFQFASYLDEIFLYGGYYKDSASSENDQSDKPVVLADLWTLDPRCWEWNKVKKSGIAPGPRAGFSMCVHKKRAILFGGVIDTDDKGDMLQSVFMNEMYAFQMDNRRWYPLELRKPKVPKTRKKPVEETTADENITDRLESTSLEEDDKTESTSDVQPVKPCGRINAGMVVGKDTLYLYGGMKEEGEREVTLDDLFALDLNKLDAWNCIIEETQCDWIEASDNEEEEEEETDENSENDEDDEDENDEAIESSQLVTEAAALLRGDGKKMSRKDRKAKIDQIRAELGLADAQRTPMPGETLKDFFARTNIYWQMAAYEHTQHTGKELRKDGFDLSETRYKELKPVLDELAKLEAEQKAEEEEALKPLKSKERAKSSKR